MKKTAKRIIAAVMAAVIGVSVITVSVAAQSKKMDTEFESQGFNVRKVSHPERGSGEVDGILPFDVMGEDVNRYQSYSWSMAEYGDSIYIGTCWNPISGIYYRNLRNHLRDYFIRNGMDYTAANEKAGKLATSLLNIFYGGNMAEGGNSQSGTPCIIRVNKETDEATLVYKESEKSQFINWNGYRTAIVFNNRLYFVCAGYPTSRLIQVDPETGTSTVVLQRTAENMGFSSGIRGLNQINGQLIVSLATDGADPDNLNLAPTLPEAMKEAIREIAKKDTRYNDPNWSMEGVRILSTTDPSDPTAWKVIANQETFDNLPACWVRDSINGGGIWDIKPFNGDLYATMVTGKTDAVTGVNHKQGFALYKGHQEGDEWTWTPIIGDTENGAKYPFGMGIDAPCAGNILPYNGYLYIGGYNDPMLDIAAIPDQMDFSKLYYDLKNPVHLYRMDPQGNIEELVDDGFGAASNQYVWNMAEYDGKLIIGTYDTSTLCSAFTQLTDGSLTNMTKEEYELRVKYIIESLKILMDKQPGKKSAAPAEISELYDGFKDLNKDVKGGVSAFRSSDKDIFEKFEAVKALYEKKVRPILSVIDKNLTAKIDEFFANPDVESLTYYMAISDIMSESVKGFDLLVSEDGVNFKVVTRDGFGDPYNHGAKGLLPTDSGLYVGTANPFWGTQLWKLTSAETEAPDTTEPTDPDVTEPTDPDTTEPTDPEATEPTDPEVTEPTDPEVTETTDPEATEPTDPEVTEPTDPEVTEPTDPEATEPTAPEVTESTGENESASDDTAAPEAPESPETGDALPVALLIAAAGTTAGAAAVSKKRRK